MVRLRPALTIAACGLLLTLTACSAPTAAPVAVGNTVSSAGASTKPSSATSKTPQAAVPVAQPVPAKCATPGLVADGHTATMTFEINPKPFLVVGGKCFDFLVDYASYSSTASLGNDQKIIADCKASGADQFAAMLGHGVVKLGAPNFLADSAASGDGQTFINGGECDYASAPTFAADGILMTYYTDAAHPKRYLKSWKNLAKTLYPGQTMEHSTVNGYQVFVFDSLKPAQYDYLIDDGKGHTVNFVTSRGSLSKMIPGVAVSTVEYLASK